MRDDEVGAGEAREQLGSDGGEHGCVLHIKPSEAVNRGEVFAEPAASVGRAHEPVAGVGELAIFKDGNSGGADAVAGAIGGFKIEGGEGHVCKAGA